MKKHEYRYTSFAARRAKSLRHSMTPPERHLWYDYLRTSPWKFQRQKPIGPYIVDFICYEHRLILELDGESHADDDAYNHDERRDSYLRKQGFRVPRLTNRDIQNHFQDVCTIVEQAIASPHIHGRIGSDAM